MRSRSGGTTVSVAVTPARSATTTWSLPDDAARLLLGGQLRPMDLIEVTGADGTQASVAGSVYIGRAYQMTRRRTH
jgi:hypothetical protein